MRRLPPPPRRRAEMARARTRSRQRSGAWARAGRMRAACERSRLLVCLLRPPHSPKGIAGVRAEPLASVPNRGFFGKVAALYPQLTFCACTMGGARALMARRRRLRFGGGAACSPRLYPKRRVIDETSTCESMTPCDVLQTDTPHGVSEPRRLRASRAGG